MPARDDEGASYEFSAPRLIFRTRDTSLVKSKDLLISDGGARYLVADYYAAEEGWRSWRLYNAEVQLRWARPRKTTDDLTGLPRAAGAPQDMGLIWATTELERRMFSDPALKIPIERRIYITNQPVKENDFLDGKQVVRANLELGLYIIEAK
jgi:hypothetical protein